MGRSGETIENLYVSIEADIAKLLSGAEKGISLVEKELQKIDKATGSSARELELLKKVIKDLADSSGKSFREVGEELRKAFETQGITLNMQQVNQAVKSLENEGTSAFDNIVKSIFGKIVALKLLEKALDFITNLLSRLAQIGVEAFKKVTKGAFDANAQFEMFHAQLTTLLGSTEAADARLRELIKFAIKTPFELPGIIEASRTLQIFGGNLLATGENLTLVGDIAAGVNQQFESVALWVGRLYDAMQSGQPFGIAALYLQRMGVLTGQTRRELEKLQEEGASGQEMWARFVELVGPKFSGNMERMSGTMTGIISNLKDMAWNLMRIGGEDAFEIIRDAARELFKLLEKERPNLEKIARAIGDIAANVADFLTTGLIERLQSLDTSSLLEMIDGLWMAAENARVLVEMLMQLGDDNVVGPMDMLAGAVSDLNWALSMAIPLVGNYVASTATQASTLTRLNEVMEEHNRRVREHGEVSEEAADSVNTFTEAIQARLQAIQQEIDRLKAAADAERELAEEFAMDLLDIQAETGEKLAELYQDHLQKLNDIPAATAERKAEAIRRANEAIADLEAETARQRAEEQQEFRTQEIRAEEDYNREMMRLRLRLQDDLQDAIKNRDARAIVDLLRRYKRERQEREEDFSARRQREREDQEQRLRALEENERRRKQEIQRSLQAQLADLDRAGAQAIAKENQNYRQRQAELNSALAKRLATIARELADEEKVNEAGARRILTQLNKTFGIGGDIDKLMEDFAARRRQKMIVRVSFEQDTQVPPSRRNQPYVPGQPIEFQHGGTVVARRPTLALFGEGGVPEMATFTPLTGGGPRQEIDINLHLSGSAPPGIRSADRDAIAGVVVEALRSTGVLRVRG